MGWNDARMSLLPIGAKLIVETDPNARTADGSALRILHSAAGSTPGPSAAEIRAWLEGKGFAPSGESPTYYSSRREDVDLFVASASDRVSQIIVTFVLNPKSFLRVAEWQDLIAEFHERWGLDLVDRRTAVSVGLADFPRLLAESAAWREFARAYQWPEASKRSVNYDLELAAEMLPEVGHTWPANEAA
jgi:hypothetical protein